MASYFKSAYPALGLQACYRQSAVQIWVAGIGYHRRSSTINSFLSAHQSGGASRDQGRLRRTFRWTVFWQEHFIFKAPRVE